VQSYQELASSAAVCGNGFNVEHALHLLYLANGNIQVTFYFSCNVKVGARDVIMMLYIIFSTELLVFVITIHLSFHKLLLLTTSPHKELKQFHPNFLCCSPKEFNSMQNSDCHGSRKKKNLKYLLKIPKR
jgi:hypothetical protein